MKKSNVILLLLLIVSTILFLCWGLNSDNIDFFLPRRIKKISAILLTSYCIGYSSVTFQTITNNRILTPSVMGLDSLYLFVQTLIVFFFGAGKLVMLTGTVNYFLSIGVMLIFSIILFVLLFLKEGRSVYFLVMVGMIIGGLFQGLATCMQVLLDPNEFLILQGKMFASFEKVNEDILVVSIFIVLCSIVVTWKDYGTLDVMGLGREMAINLGVPYQKMVLKNLLNTAVLVSVSTALTGPITFLGILVASLARVMISTYHHKSRVCGAVLLGGFALIFGQMMVERVFQFKTTISVIINFIGGVYFLILMMKERER